MAVHNDARFLASTLDGVFGQTFSDFELVAVDDASTDATRALLQSADDHRLRYIRNDVNLGQVPSLNRGLAVCRGAFIARIDGDDRCEPDRLLRQLEYLERHPTLAGCATWITEIDEEDKEIGALEPCPDPAHVRWELCHTNRLYHPTMMVRREAYDRMGGYNEAYPATEDYELWTRMLSGGFSLGIVPQRLVRYRRRRGSITDTHRELQRNVGLRIATAYINTVVPPKCSESSVALMRTLLSWAPIEAQAPATCDVRKALDLMWAIRMATVAKTNGAALRAADREVARHLSRHAHRRLADAPAISVLLGRYLTRLPGHRARGVALVARALRCMAGTARRRYSPARSGDSLS